MFLHAKLVFAFAFIAAVTAGATSYNKRSDHFGHHYEVSHHDGHHGHHDYVHHPSYKYEYGVHDPHTHDHKSQWEHRDGDAVKGEYTLDEADGTKRVVKYSSDKHGGFEAHVERIGHASHPAHYHHHY
jgi:hypothetical protein